MKHLQLQVKLVGGILPEWKSMEDAGLDLHASEDTTIRAGECAKVKLGICTAFSPQFVAVLKDRSGHGSKQKYTHAGVIDSSYRGEWLAILENASSEDWAIKRGDRIVQALFVPCFHLRIVETESLPDSDRGLSGFGSSG